ncbi:MAG: hypothetical protein GXP49_12635 [Deltaproteobacteria bacterium]|nr:hypothetical protein [Deltaproteobacteria bacterium]
MNKAARLKRSLRKRNKGQAMVLAAVSMLILALGILVTVNLGHAVHQRIRLQNAADAGAYSLAAMEARTFNYFAFTNRAQVVNYNAMMTLNAYIALLTRAESMFGVASDNMYYIHTYLCWLCRVGCKPPITTFGCWACPLKSVVAGLGNAARAVANGFGAMLNVADPALAMLVSLSSMANYVGTFTSQYVMGSAVLSHIADSMKSITSKDSEEVDFNAFQMLVGAYNYNEYKKAFDPAVGSPPAWPRGWTPPASDSNVKKAKRVMAEIVNATRYPANHLTWQTIPGFAFSASWIGGQTKLIDEAKFNPSTDLRGKYIGPGPGWGVRDTRTKAQDESKLSPGDTLASDSWYRFSLPAPGGFNAGTMYSLYVVASHDKNKRRHLRWKAHTFNQAACNYTYGMIQVGHFGLAKDPHPKAGSNDDIDTRHAFQGITPFMKFAALADAKQDFHQPSAYVMLNKKPEKLKRIFTKKFNYRTGAGSSTKVDMNIGRKGLMGTGAFKGLTSLSRAMAYYHRPGDWQEQPNFFNPFWRAKLAPLATDKELAGLLGSVPGLGNLLKDNLLLH